MDKSQETMTAEQARTFDSFSEANARLLVLAAAARGCQCLPYTDWFTYKRWKAQGAQVQKGQSGTALTVYITRYKDGEDGTRKESGSYPRTTYVFCRCQVGQETAK